MNILAVDTAGKTVGVALMQGDRLLYECYLDAGMTHSETLMPLIDGCLRLCGLTCKDIDLFGVNAGPGSFTGLRIGLAAVKGLAFPRETLCAPVSTLEALAAAHTGEGTVLCALDARRAQVYSAAFDLATHARLLDDDARAVADLAQFVENCKKPLFFVGDGASLCYNKYSNVPGVLCVPPALRGGRAAAVALVAKQMAERGEAVLPEALLPDYHRLSQAERERAERLAAAQAQLRQLAEQGLVSARSIYIDEANGMVSFSYSCGVQGGILVDDPEEENAAVTLSQMPSVDLQEMSNAPRGNLGSAMIYYAFDNTVNSSRYPYYSYMKGFWTAMGLSTRIDTMVTVADLRRMDRYDLCILSAHGAYYTYARGLFRQLRTEPVILLTEESSITRDLFYGFDLLTHRVIKINGRYCVTAGFFKNAYRFGQLKNTLVYSETCEFLGVDDSIDLSMANALLAGGASAVVGYVNNVYTVYSRSMLWDTVNYLILGQSIGQAVAHAQATYGTDDLVWYTAQGGKRPHAAAAYTMLLGDSDAALPILEEPADETPVQQAA